MPYLFVLYGSNVSAVSFICNNISLILLGNGIPSIAEFSSIDSASFIAKKVIIISRKGKMSPESFCIKKHEDKRININIFFVMPLKQRLLDNFFCTIADNIPDKKSKITSEVKIIKRVSNPPNKNADIPPKMLITPFIKFVFSNRCSSPKI